MDFMEHIEKRIQELSKHHDELALNIENAKVELNRIIGSIIELSNLKKTASESLENKEKVLPMDKESKTKEK